MKYRIYTTNGIKVLTTTSKSLKFYDDNGLVDTSLGVAVISGVLRVFKFNHHEYNRLFMASSRSSLSSGATLARHGIAQATIDKIPELQLASLECIDVIE